MKKISPAQKHKSSFSVILLCNDRQAVSFHLSPFWIKFLVAFVLIFSGVSGAAGYAAHYYWQKYNRLQQERNELAAKLGENRRQLGRFAGIEKIKEATQPRSSMAEIAVEAEQPLAAQTGAKPAKGDEAAQTAATPEPLEPKADQITLVSESPSTVVMAHPAAIDDVKIVSTGGSRYQLSYTIRNKNEKGSLDGKVTLAVTTASGERYPVTQLNQDALSFYINRYKNVSLSFTLPAEIPPKNVKSLHLVISAKGLPDVTYMVPMM